MLTTQLDISSIFTARVPHISLIAAPFFFIIQQSAPIAYFSRIGIFDGSSNINCVSITGHLFLLGFGNS